MDIERCDSGVRWAIAIAASSVALFACSTSQANASSVSEGLVAHFQLDGDAVDELAISSGVLVGGTPVPDRFGNADGAIDFDGNDDYIEIEHTDALSLDHFFSISAWISYRPQADDTWYTVFEKSDPERGGHSRYGMWIRDDKIWLCFEAVDYSRQPCGIAEGTIPHGGWHHVAAVRSGTQALMYVDGIEVGSYLIGQGRVSESSFLAFIGTDLYSEAPVYLNATLDDIRIYDRTLLPTEVAELAEVAS